MSERTGAHPSAHPVRTGLVDVVPILLGVLPFGLVTGAVAADVGLAASESAGLSAFVFAGASQLAAMDLLSDGSGPLVAAATAWVVNLRFLLYGAALAPKLAAIPMGRRVVLSYFLIDQNYALAETRFTPGWDARSRFGYFLTASLTFWSAWIVTTAVGHSVGASVPDEVPLEFGVPLMFLALLLPVLATWPQVVAALVGGLGTVAFASLGVGRLALLCGIALGVVVGWTAATLAPRRV